MSGLQIKPLYQFPTHEIHSNGEVWSKERTAKVNRINRVTDRLVPRRKTHIVCKDKRYPHLLYIQIITPIKGKYQLTTLSLGKALYDHFPDIYPKPPKRTWVSAKVKANMFIPPIPIPEIQPLKLITLTDNILRKLSWPGNIFSADGTNHYKNAQEKTY